MTTEFSKAQELALLVPILIAVVGAGGYLWNWYEEPNLINGQYFDVAVLDYGKTSNALYIEFTPDGTGERALLAIHEAGKRIGACKKKRGRHRTAVQNGRPFQT